MNYKIEKGILYRRGKSLKLGDLLLTVLDARDDLIVIDLSEHLTFKGRDLSSDIYLALALDDLFSLAYSCLELTLLL